MARERATTYRFRLYPKPAQEAYLRVAVASRRDDFPACLEGDASGSFSIPFRDPADIERNKVRLPELGWVNAKCWREVEGAPTGCTISVDRAARWWVSIRCKDAPAERVPRATGTAVVTFGAGNTGNGTERCGSAGRKGSSAKPDAACHASDAAPGSTPKASSCTESDSPEAIRLRVERRRERRASRKLERRRAASPDAPSKRCRQQELKVARARAHRLDSLKTQCSQVASALVRGNAEVVVRGSPLTEHDRQLVRALKDKCLQTGRRLVFEE